jgi:threonine dehydrogenase-like Zn-dependent dehydrogenase
LCTIAALAYFRSDVDPIIAVAKHPEQQRRARELGASVIVEPAELRRAVRRQTGSGLLDDGRLTGGAGMVFDCVGSADSIHDALAVIEPGGTVVLLGMPGPVHIDLTGLWQREIRLEGAYAYGTERVGGGSARTFDLAFELVGERRLGRLVTSTYPLERYREAIEHAANAGRRGAVKVVFDLRKEKRR